MEEEDLDLMEEDEEEGNSNDSNSISEEAEEGENEEECNGDLSSKGEDEDSKQKRQKPMGEDRISALPDSIIHHFLSLLPMKDVLKTGVLSKRWKDIWTSVPTIDISYTGECECFKRFFQLINRTLILYSSEKIKKFSLSFDYSHATEDMGEPELDVNIASLLRFATIRNVEELNLLLRVEFDDEGDYRYVMPHFLYQNSSLTKLHSSFCYYEPKASVSWTSLKVLTISVTKFEKGILQKLLLGSPLLECLELLYCVFLEHDKIDTSSNTGLKRLVIMGMVGELTMSILNVSSLEISGLSEYDHYDDLTYFELLNVSSSLVEVTLDFGLDYCYNGEQFSQEVQDMVFHLLEKVLSLLELKGLPSPLSIHKRKCLTLATDFEERDLYGVASLLSISPNLEKLVIKLTDYHFFHSKELDKLDDEKKENFWKAKERFFECLLCLKTVEIVGLQSPCNGLRYWINLHSGLFEFVEFILGSARVLERIVLVPERGSKLEAVAAINSLYTSLGSPPLVGWIAVGGDPCVEQWQGVSCVFSNITELKLNGMNLGGVLDEGIGGFVSIMLMDLSHNQIGGSIPSNLPLTLRNLYLSGNQFNGSIPPTLSTLTQLTELFLDDNHLSEAIPDSFQGLKGLLNLDLSGNNLSGPLPPSFANLSSLTTLHLQNNQISGVLDVLQDLPLTDLNVENNILSGPIPAKLLNIPNFRKDGNPFNTTILPSPPAALPPSIAWAPSPFGGPRVPNGEPSTAELPQWAKARKFWTNQRVIWIAVAGLVAILLLGVLLLLVWRCCKGRQGNKNSDKPGVDAYEEGPKKLNQINKSSSQPTYQTDKVAKEAVEKPVDGYDLESEGTGISSKLQDEQVADVTRMPSRSRDQKTHGINTGGLTVKSFSLRPPLPPPLLPPEEVGVSPIHPAEINVGSRSSRGQNSRSTSVFTVASLQQYTDSFAEENFIGQGMLGSVYRGELPDGKLLAIKKLDTRASRWKSDAEFLEIVSDIAKLKHPNIVELVGYCNEHGQRLLVYEYCRNGTLNDLLHGDDGIKKKLSWSARVRVALGVARALQYLHEVCQPPIVHKNIKSVNILLDDKLTVHVSECGLAPFLSSSGSASEFSGSFFVSSGYAAPEIELGNYTCQSDVYSLGVLMLELLTGRKSFDRSRPLGEQFLVRWAIPQLHDIDALSRMVDRALNGSYPMKSLSRFADIISRCVQWEPGFRPPISEIVQDLVHMI
ncbi:hypothetical protein CCACVL1_15609 [Corchorus capsularis]|uniref:Protein kinase domain-containing protein n=1 Tax=Corchorus capsularis TaxID=210143 RepID=A0A1R3I1Q9_COCAP|nr:hypothetical protein CCACVL1_15609 [Corchorus capsularis]